MKLATTSPVTRGKWVNKLFRTHFPLFPRERTLTKKMGEKSARTHTDTCARSQTRKAIWGEDGNQCVTRVPNVSSHMPTNTRAAGLEWLFACEKESKGRKKTMCFGFVLVLQHFYALLLFLPFFFSFLIQKDLFFFVQGLLSQWENEMEVREREGERLLYTFFACSTNTEYNFYTRHIFHTAFRRNMNPSQTPSFPSHDHFSPYDFHFVFCLNKMRLWNFHRTEDT